MTSRPAPVAHTYGYARVSTRSQRLDAQLDALAAVATAEVFVDTVTGRTMDRPGWAECRRHLRAGDELVVVGLDRLGRSALEVVETVNRLAADGVTVRSLREGVLDPTTATGALILSMFAAIGQFEVDLKSERAAAAREAYAARSERTGRPRAHDDELVDRAVDLRRRGATIAEIVDATGIPRATLYRYLKGVDAVERERADREGAPVSPLVAAFGAKLRAAQAAEAAEG